MSEKNYTVVEKWMGQLGLTSTELLIYATIYGFTQKENGKFTGHLSYFKEQFGISRAAATKAIAHLVELKLIEKKAANYGGRYSRCSTYTAAPTENYKLLDGTSTCIDSQHQLYQYDTSTCVDSQHQLYQNDTSTCVDSQHQLYQNDTSITYITYNDNIEEDNIIDNNITPGGDNSDCESDIVESENGDECYCESDNSQIELSFGDDIADNNINNADTADTAEIKKSTGSKKKDTKTGTKSKKAQEAGQDFREQSPSRELSTQKDNKSRVQESEQNSREQSPSRELGTQKNNKNRVQEAGQDFREQPPSRELSTQKDNKSRVQEAGQDFREQSPSRELASQKNNKNRAQESEQNSRAEPPSRELASQKNNKNRTQERFDKFWAAYPRHIDKAKALKAFTKINPSDELLERMLNTIGQAKKTRQWQTQQYIPYPTTWLNGSRWEDEIDPKDIDYDIAHPHSLDNPTDRAVANGENPFASDDWW